MGRRVAGHFALWVAHRQSSGSRGQGSSSGGGRVGHGLGRGSVEVLLKRGRMGSGSCSSMSVPMS